MKVRVSYRSDGKVIFFHPKKTFVDFQEAQQWVIRELIQKCGLTYTKRPRNWMHGYSGLTYWSFVIREAE